MTGTMTTLEKNRDAFDYLSLSRGFAIAWIASSHAAIPQIRAINPLAEQLFLSMYAIALPMFMCLAGHFFELGLEKYARQGYLPFLRGKFRRLMVPYLIFSSLAYLGMAAGAAVPSVAGLMERFSFHPRGFMQAAAEIVTMDNLVAKHLWFCYTLFLIFAITYPLAGFWKKWPGLAVAFLLYLVDMRYQDELPYMLERIFQYMLFFQTGRWLRLSEKWFRPALLPAYGLAAATVYILFNNVDIKGAGLSGGSIVYLVGISGALFFYTLMRVAARTPAARLLDGMGRYSYDVYLLHQPVLTAGTAGLLWTFFPWLRAWGTILLGAAIGFGASCLISRYILRPVPVLRRYFLGMK